MNLHEEKMELEQKLKDLEQYQHELDRMAQECFAGLKKRYDVDIETTTDMFIGIGVMVAALCDDVRSKLGLQNIVHVVPTPTPDDHDPIPLKSKNKRG